MDQRGKIGKIVGRNLDCSSFVDTYASKRSEVIQQAISNIHKGLLANMPTDEEEQASWRDIARRARLARAKEENA